VKPIVRRIVALGYGTATHTLFVAGVGLMLVNLHQGMLWGQGRLAGPAALAANLALAVQFPLVHSLLLSRRGRAVLARLAPRPLGQDLTTTVFAAIAALQLVLTFLLWSPSGVVWWAPTGRAAGLHTALYAAAWLVLLRAMSDAGLARQTGSLGWTAAFRGRPPAYGPFPTTGLFRVVRQPVYLAFALTLWTGPVWTPDRLALASGWTAYCILAPRLKERRYLRWYGEAFARYRRRVPYMLPWPGRTTASVPGGVPAAPDPRIVV
jgi:protein-S-isoprenylcysteine O-methyltransferase Ste14